MEILSILLLIAAVIISAVVVLKIFAAPVKLVFKLLLNMASGFLLLILANLVSGFFDFSVPINTLSCLLSGVFGIPGVILLIVIKIFWSVKMGNLNKPSEYIVFQMELKN